MSDRELAWAVINCDRTDGEATDAAARYVSELEQSIERCQALNRMMRAQLQAIPLSPEGDSLLGVIT